MNNNIFHEIFLKTTDKGISFIYLLVYFILQPQETRKEPLVKSHCWGLFMNLGSRGKLIEGSSKVV